MFWVLVLIAIFLLIVLPIIWSRKDSKEFPEYSFEEFMQGYEAYERPLREKWLKDNEEEIEKIKALDRDEDTKWLAEILRKYDISSEEDKRFLVATLEKIRYANERKWFFVIRSQNMKHAYSNSEKKFYKMMLERKLEERNSTTKDCSL